MLNDIIDKYNNTCHSTIKMKPANVKFNSYDGYGVKDLKMLKILNLKQVIMLEFQSIRIFLLKDILLIGQRKILYSANLKILYHGKTL